MLNAFRHLRKEHCMESAEMAQAVVCSTPFGIYGRNTFGSDGGVGSPGVCSTPFGIYGRNTWTSPAVAS